MLIQHKYTGDILQILLGFCCLCHVAEISKKVSTKQTFLSTYKEQTFRPKTLQHLRLVLHRAIVFVL